MSPLKKSPKESAATPSDTTATDSQAVETAANASGKKGRPTPTRAEAEAARKRPLVPEDRRAAAKAARAKAREMRDAEYQAMKNGDESKMPYRDRGPVKKYIRDFVDARRNLGEYFLFLALLFLFATLFTSQLKAYAVLPVLLMYVVVIITVIDGFILWRQLKKRLVAKFGNEVLNTRGLMMYSVMRAFQFRRGRLPKPMVKHGEYPH
ncbi:DUF3043 domain-containing protein [Timonella sp. A28]|uniref:DUF3043 domain-containing protein n=1 Tax=Timonella sp. A28 TaxID=3442640 RepID=UPI003EBE9A0F